MKYALMIFFSAVTICIGQGTFTVTFDQPPPLPPAGSRYETNYFEAGMWLRRDPPDVPLVLSRGFSGFPDNGTTYLVPYGSAYGIGMVFSLADGTPFDLKSVDISNYPTPSNGSFIGYLSDGSTVSTNFTPIGVKTFQTYQFGPEFSNLTRVEIPSAVPLTQWALDNIVFSAIPEPCASALMLFAGGLLAFGRRLRRTVVRDRATKFPRVERERRD